MPTRATKRGAKRTPLTRDSDVLICGGSFAGLAVARELAGCGARVLMIDRYELGERQTSACAIPTVWLQAMDLLDSMRQTFDELVVHTPSATSRWQLPWSFSTFDYRELCALLYSQADERTLDFETATVTAREGTTVHTDRGDLRAPLIVDGLGWRRVLSNDTTIQPPEARLSRGLEVHPQGHSADMELWLDPRYVRAGYSWNFPAGAELRVGVGSFWPAHHVKQPTVALAHDLGVTPERYQGNWIPHELRPAVEDGVFFVGDSAGHCLPLTAEGIRTALYFGLACGRELRAVVEGRRSRAEALSRYGAFSAAHARKYRWLLRVQHGIGRLMNTPIPTALSLGMRSRRAAAWGFDHYLAIAPPTFVGPPASRSAGRQRATAKIATA